MALQAFKPNQDFPGWGDWPAVDFVKLYKRTRHIPDELDKMKKKCSPIALFVVGVWRGRCYPRYTGYFENETKEYFGISTGYCVSAN